MCHSCGNKFELRAIQEITDTENASTGESKYDWDTYEPRNYEDIGKVCLSGYSCPFCGAEITGDDTLGSTCVIIADSPPLSRVSLKERFGLITSSPSA